MNDPERLDRAIDRLLADRSPRIEAGELAEEDLEMLRMAQLIRGTTRGAPDPHFTERLRAKLFAGRSRRISRRSAFLAGLGALAAGAIGTLSIERLLPKGLSSAGTVTDHGHWFHVADLASVHEGAVLPFTAGSVDGFLINRRGGIHALSRVCTHMGCTLRYDGQDRALHCPCHGAEFDLQGQMVAGPGGYGTTYGYSLPPLPSIHVRVRGQSVEVLGVQV
jgi:nitrite reductase/ring-hydroxylating ferredoxin subunit